MAPKSRVELYAAIRRDCRVGMTKRAVMRKYGVGHPTVQNALESAWPRPRKKLPPRPTRLDPYKPLIDQMLRTDLDAPRKQRHTAKRVSTGSLKSIRPTASPTTWSATTLRCAGARSGRQPVAVPLRRSCRSRTVLGWRPRSTSGM